MWLTYSSCKVFNSLENAFFCHENVISNGKYGKYFTTGRDLQLTPATDNIFM